MVDKNMPTTPLNPNWHLLANLRPKLRKHVCTYPQKYRGERWYLLRDQTSGRHLRFNASAYEFIGRLDGEYNVEEIYQQVLSTGNDGAPNQDEIIVILTQLFAMDLLRSQLPAEATEFFNRFQNQRRISKQRTIMNPLAIRIPLMDPDSLLNLCMPWVRPLFSRTGAMVCFITVLLASFLGLANFSALSASVNSNILSPSNFVLMLLVFIVIKVIHEFAHAFTVKMWGGEVHEMGVTLLVLAPVPYMDASAAWEISDKRKRALVGAIGVICELFIASLALFVWLTVEPGLVQDIAFNALLIGTISTLLFNANPLLRFDGYYVLQDLIEIPNLYSRASRYYIYLIQYYLFGIKSAHSPVTADGEAIWFLIYGLVTFFYRIFILSVIVLFLIEEYLFIGVALGSWAIMSQIFLPIFKGLQFLFVGAQLTGRRARSAVISLLLISSISAILLFLPVSLTSHAEGVVWVKDQALVYSGADGFVDQVLVDSGTPITANTALIEMRSLSLDIDILKLNARLRELEILRATELFKHRVQSEITRAELESVKAELSLLTEQKASLTVYSKESGTFVLPDESKVAGRYLVKGELIGYVISPQRLIIRAIIPQSEIGLLRKKVSQVEIRFAERLNETVIANIIRETPAGSKTLPSRALGATGGGSIAVNMSDSAGLTASEEVFIVDLAVSERINVAGIGERVFIRFKHGTEPLAIQWLRRGRQLVLSRLSF
jgi:putative peptide zinc metalloprotease protein